MLKYFALLRWGRTRDNIYKKMKVPFSSTMLRYFIRKLIEYSLKYVGVKAMFTLKPHSHLCNFLRKALRQALRQCLRTNCVLRKVCPHLRTFVRKDLRGVVAPTKSNFKT